MKTINNIDIEQWNKLSRQSIVSNFFQTKECYDFYRSLSFLEEFCFGVEDNGLLKGVIIGYIQKEVGKVKQFLSKRAIIIGGPLLADDISEEALEQLYFRLNLPQLRD